MAKTDRTTNGLSRTFSSSEMLIRAGKEVAKSAIVTKVVQESARRSGLVAAGSAAGMAAWAGSLLLARKVHPDYMDPVSSNQINRDPEFCMNVHIVLQSRDVVNAEDLRKTFEFYLQHFPRFRQRAVVRDWLWPYWESVERLDLDQHILMDTTEMDHEAMQDFIARSLTQSMNPLIPLWKVSAFPNYTLDDGTPGSAVVVKYHHCMGDGFSFARAVMSGAEWFSSLPASPAPAQSSVAPAAQRVHRPGQFGKFAEAAVKMLTVKDDPPSPLKAQKLLKPLDERIAIWVIARASLQEIKRGAKAHGFTVNDVVLGALSATLRHFLQSKGMAPFDALSVVWVALRPLSEAYLPQDMSGDVEQPTNKTLGSVYLRLPIEKEYGTCMERVKAVAERIEAMKGSPEPLLSQIFVSGFGLLPRLLSNPAWDALSNKVSISVSNVPGPQTEFKVGGIRPVSFQFFVPVVGTISSFVLITSYNDRLSLSLTLDRAVFSKADAAFITKTFDEELNLVTSSMLRSKL